MKSRIVKSMVVLFAVAAVAGSAQGGVWFEDTIETSSPAVQWDSGTYKYMADTSVHGDGTLAPYDGGYKVASGYPGDQLYYHTTSGSHFTGIANGLWSADCAYTLLTDPNNSQSGTQRARFDVRFSTIGDSITFYIGEVVAVYTSLQGTTSDPRAYGAVQFLPGDTAGKLNVRFSGDDFDVTISDALDLDWNTTYRVFADFDTDTDQVSLKVADDAAGTNVLGSASGTVALQLGATTMNALNGWTVQTFGNGNGWGQDNFVFESYSANPTLEVTPDERVVTNYPGQTTFEVVNTNQVVRNMIWTANETEDWLTISSGSSGNDDGTITIDFTENTTGAERTGTITITAGGANGSPKEVTVRQLAGNAWFEDTIQPDSPAVAWDSGDNKYMASQTAHGDGTLEPHGGGYKVASSGDQLYYHTTSGSHFTGISAGLWTTSCQYTLLADPTNSHSGNQSAQFDIRVSTIGGGINFYLGEMKSPYTSLVGTTQDMLAYAVVGFRAGDTAGKLNVQLLGTTFSDALDMDWGTTYRVFADFNTDTDTVALKVTSDAAGTNVLAGESGTVTTQLGATTMNALNGWQVTCFGSGHGWGQDNFVLKEFPSTPVLSVIPEDQLVAKPAGQTSFEVLNSNPTAGSMAWTAAVDPADTWLSIDSGSSGTDAGTIEVSYTTNYTGATRTGEITVTAAGAAGSPKVVTVTQLRSNAWFEDTIEPDSPAVRWNSSTHKFMDSPVHGDGTLAPYGGGYKVGSYTTDTLRFHETSGSHFTGTANGLWTAGCQYTLLADPTNSHSGEQRAQFDVRFSELAASMNFYIGETKSPYTSLVGTTHDLLAFAVVGFRPGNTAGMVNVQLLDTTFTDLFAVDWATTYRVFADFNTDTDTAVLKITSDAAGLNVLATESGTVTTQLGAMTMNALNGWHVSTFGGGNGWGQDNFTFGPVPIACADPNLVADLNTDCEVNLIDLSLLAGGWLECTLPNGANCQDLGPGGVTSLMYMKEAQSSITVDGVLTSDWADAEWIDMTVELTGYPLDLASAQIAVKWDATTDKVYAAVKVDDSEHIFVDNPATWLWNSNDGVEIYAQGDTGAATTGWEVNCDTAQQYMVAPDTTTPTPVVLSRWGNGDPLEPGDDFEGVIAVSGDVITYEFGIQMFDLYGERSGAATVDSALAIGKQIRFDLVAGSKSASNYGWLAMNDLAGKSVNAAQMQLWELVGTTAPPGNCDGSWGYLDEDINEDCFVDLQDFSALVNDWTQ